MISFRASAEPFQRAKQAKTAPIVVTSSASAWPCQHSKASQEEGIDDGGDGDDGDDDDDKEDDDNGDDKDNDDDYDDDDDDDNDNDDDLCDHD
eukprot:754389-Karenia_brevis.AAC.1